jgi:hypothetical protein
MRPSRADAIGQRTLTGPRHRCGIARRVRDMPAQPCVCTERGGAVCPP